MTTHQPPAQPDYLAELGQIADALHGPYMRLHDIMRRYETQPPNGEAGSDEWHDCYRAAQALHLASQLVSVARDNEQARNAPVPFLPADEVDEYLHLAAQLTRAAIDNEQARRAPVPFLPVEPAAQSHLRAILDDELGDGA